MSAILYYLIIIPLSLLPFRVLYLFSDFIYLILYKGFGYRKKVVLANLRNSFPEKSEEEIQAICRKFYHHLCDIMVESIKLFTLSPKKLQKHFKCTNPELPERYYLQGRSGMGLTCHYANWEWLATTISAHSSHLAVGIYQPLTNQFFEQKMRKSRGKVGTFLVGVKQSKEVIETKLKTDKIFVCTIIDQTPSNPERCYWTKFMGQDTAVHLGMDKYARDYNLPILFAKVKKVKRGYYEVNYEVICEHPQETKLGEIAELYTRKTEEIIRQQPEYWLWSHRRWKHKKP